MDFKRLKQWGNKQFKCECGFVTQNKNKKEHLNSNLHEILNKYYNYENVKGTDIVNCNFCNQKMNLHCIPTHFEFKHKKSLNIH